MSQPEERAGWPGAGGPARSALIRRSSVIAIRDAELSCERCEWAGDLLLQPSVPDAVTRDKRKGGETGAKAEAGGGLQIADEEIRSAVAER